MLMTSNDCSRLHTHLHKHTRARTQRPEHLSRSASVHLCQYVCLGMHRFILLTYFLHQKQSSQRLGKGLILCKYMQMTVTQNSILIGCMQMMFAKHAYRKGISRPPLISNQPTTPFTFQTPHSPLPCRPLSFPFDHFHFCPPSVSFNRLSTLSFSRSALPGPPLCPPSFSPSHCNPPLHPHCCLSVCCMAV